jgi:hypothetical protein
MEGSNMSTSTVADGSILSLDEVRQALGVQEVAIKRLIARGKLTATAIGIGGPLRVLSSDLTAYVKKGAIDIDLPPLAGTWFSPDDTRQAGGFQSAVFKAMDGQWPTNETVQKFATKDRDQMNFSVTVNADGGRAVIMQAPTSPLPGKPASRFENLGGKRQRKSWDSKPESIGSTPARNSTARRLMKPGHWCNRRS